MIFFFFFLLWVDLPDWQMQKCDWNTNSLGSVVSNCPSTFECALFFIWFGYHLKEVQSFIPPDMSDNSSYITHPARERISSLGEAHSDGPLRLLSALSTSRGWRMSSAAVSASLRSGSGVPGEVTAASSSVPAARQHSAWTGRSPQFAPRRSLWPSPLTSRRKAPSVTSHRSQDSKRPHPVMSSPPKEVQPAFTVKKKWAETKGN